MSMLPPPGRFDRYGWMIVGVGGVAVLGAIFWGGLQPEDPLSVLIHTDKMRHVVGFSAFGLLASLLPRRWQKLAGIAAACAIGLGLEFVQSFSPDREASWRDLGASCIGVFTGFGVGLAMMMAGELVVGELRRRRKPR